METRMAELRSRYAEAKPDERRQMEDLAAKMHELDSEAIAERYLKPECNTSLPDPNFPQAGADVPGLLMLAPRELLERLDQLHTGYRICLNLSDLHVEDVLEMLYDCRGMITHLEIFNLKDHVAGKTSHYGEISELQMAINEGNVITLKRLIRNIRQRLEHSEHPDREDRIAKLTEVLCNIPALQSHYRAVPLGAYIGSDSTGRSLHRYGMGLIIRETLSRRAQKAIAHTMGPTVFVLPVRMTAYLRTTFVPYAASRVMKKWFQCLAYLLPGLKHLGEDRRQDWEIQEKATRLETPGNIIPLGGLHEEGGNKFYLAETKSQAKPGISWRYLNSGVKNAMKVLIGFIPAFLTFALTKDWWFLAYCGAFIWFGITGLRNILQSVLGGGGIRRSPLLRWNDYVSWGRLTDSLLFTGFSVPLLDYIVKTVILDRMFGITTATNPSLLYTVMALANGLYLSSHNAFRGLPKGAIFGNFFRSILSIPLAIAFNAAIGGILSEAGVAGDQRCPAEMGRRHLQGGVRLRRRHHRRPRRPLRKHPRAGAGLHSQARPALRHLRPPRTSVPRNGRPGDARIPEKIHPDAQRRGAGSREDHHHQRPRSPLLLDVPAPRPERPEGPHPRPCRRRNGRSSSVRSAFFSGSGKSASSSWTGSSAGTFPGGWPSIWTVMGNIWRV